MLYYSSSLETFFTRHIILTYLQKINLPLLYLYYIKKKIYIYIYILSQTTIKSFVSVTVLPSLRFSPGIGLL